jgi:hypothetical protein
MSYLFKRTVLALLRDELLRMIEEGKLLKSLDEKDDWKFRRLKQDFEEALDVVFYGASEKQTRRVFSESLFNRIVNDRPWPSEAEREAFWSSKTSLSEHVFNLVDLGHDFLRLRKMKKSKKSMRA